MASGTVNSGAVVSKIIIFAIVVFSFPHSSVTVNSTGVVVVSPQLVKGIPSDAVQVKSASAVQLSCAIAIPLASVHSIIRVALLASLHSKTRSEASIIIAG